MAIENERKYVLHLNFSEAVLAGWTQERIEQSYLDAGVRIRSLDDQPIFTYKKFVEGYGLVEIEKDIDPSDYHALLQVSSEFVSKTRYKSVIGAEEWVVDFLKDKNGSTYFVMAEVEMDPGKETPNAIPPEIADSILHVVDRKDLRFTNRNLSDPSIVQQLYQNIASNSPTI